MAVRDRPQRRARRAPPAQARRARWSPTPRTPTRSRSPTTAPRSRCAGRRSATALAELPAREREIVALKFHAGLRNAEIARVLGDQRVGRRHAAVPNHGEAEKGLRCTGLTTPIDPESSRTGGHRRHPGRRGGRTRARGARGVDADPRRPAPGARPRVRHRARRARRAPVRPAPTAGAHAAGDGAGGWVFAPGAAVGHWPAVVAVSCSSPAVAASSSSSSSASASAAVRRPHASAAAQSAAGARPTRRYLPPSGASAGAGTRRRGSSARRRVGGSRLGRSVGRPTRPRPVDNGRQVVQSAQLGLSRSPTRSTTSPSRCST